MTELEIDCQTLNETLGTKPESVCIIDVREPHEFEGGTIQGSHLFTLSSLQDHVDEIQALSEGKTLITLCHHGRRSMQACLLLKAHNIDNTLSLRGGIHQWSLQIDPSIPTY